MKDTGKKSFLTEEQRNLIVSRIDLRDYFLFLVSQGIFAKGRKYPEWQYFENDISKVAVSQDKWHDFKQDEGGGVLKAVMKYENLNWLEAHYFLANFSNTNITTDSEPIEQFKQHKSLLKSEFVINHIGEPNNKKLIDYFEKKRGIPKTIFEKYTSQIHFSLKNEKGEWVKAFGLGWQNRSGGYEIKNEYHPTKLGASDYTEVGNPKAKVLFIFEGMCNLLSMATMLYAKKKDLNQYRFVSLNSVSNTGSFIKHFQNENDLIIYLCLDGDREGNKHTKKLLEAFQNAKDIRGDFYIGEDNFFNDLNDFLISLNDLQEILK